MPVEDEEEFDDELEDELEDEDELELEDDELDEEYVVVCDDVEVAGAGLGIGLIGVIGLEAGVIPNIPIP